MEILFQLGNMFMKKPSCLQTLQGCFLGGEGGGGFCNQTVLYVKQNCATMINSNLFNIFMSVVLLHQVFELR